MKHLDCSPSIQVLFVLFDAATCRPCFSFNPGFVLTRRHKTFFFFSTFGNVDLKLYGTYSISDNNKLSFKIADELKKEFYVYGYTSETLSETIHLEYEKPYEQKTEQYTQTMNALNQIPVLELPDDNNTKLRQSVAIMEYIEEGNSFIGITLPVVLSSLTFTYFSLIGTHT